MTVNKLWKGLEQIENAHLRFDKKLARREGLKEAKEAAAGVEQQLRLILATRSIEDARRLAQEALGDVVTL